MNALAGDATHLVEPQECLVSGLDCGSVTGGTDTAAIGVLHEQTPTTAVAGIQIAEPPAHCRARMSAFVPLPIDLLMAVGAVVLTMRIGSGIDPFVIGIVEFRQSMQ